MSDKSITEDFFPEESGVNCKDFKSSSLDELSFDEVMQLFAEKKKALRLKDTRKLTQLLAQHPCLFDDEVFAGVEKTFKRAQKAIQTQDAKEQAEKEKNKVVSIEKMRRKKLMPK